MPQASGGPESSIAPGLSPQDATPLPETRRAPLRHQTARTLHTRHSTSPLTGTHAKTIDPRAASSGIHIGSSPHSGPPQDSRPRASPASAIGSVRIRRGGRLSSADQWQNGPPSFQESAEHRPEFANSPGFEDGVPGAPVLRILGSPQPSIQDVSELNAEDTKRTVMILQLITSRITGTARCICASRPYNLPRSAGSASRTPRHLERIAFRAPDST